jgi:hypothetical protein
VNTAPGVLFTTLHFLCSLQIGQKARVFVPDQHLRPTEVWHSSLLGQFLSHKENEVL